MIAGTYVPYSVFGWNLHFARMRAGEFENRRVPQDVPRSKNPYLALWTKGRIDIVRQDDDQVMPSRTPGYYSAERPDVQKGTYVMTAVEDSEWWCIDAQANGNKLPAVSPLRLSAGDCLELPAESRVLLCAGELLVGETPVNGPVPITLANISELTAVTDCYGLIFE